MAGWWDAIPAIAQAAGAAVGYQQQNQYGQQALTAQQQAYQDALNQIGNTSYKPAQAQTIGPSAMAGVQPDAQSINAEKTALAELTQASREGYNAVDKAAINGLMQDIEQQERGGRDAALAHTQPGSGQALAARMNAQASGAAQENNKALSIAAGSRAKALDALTQEGNLASNIRNQSFGEGAQKAQAEDAISKFNGQVGQFNAGAANQASQQGIQNAQGAVAGVGGAANSLAAGLNTQGGNIARQDTAIGGMVGNGAGAVGSAAFGSSGSAPAPTSASNLTSLANANSFPADNASISSGNGYPPYNPDDWKNWGEG